jgi:hypothetical protein
MSLPKPSAKPNWTNATPTNREEPVSGLKDTGWGTNDRPQHKFFNWILWILGQWVDYFEDITDRLNQYYQTVIASLMSATFKHETPTGSGRDWMVSAPPVNDDSLWLYLDNRILTKSEFALSGRNITLAFDMEAGQTLDAVFMTQVPVGPLSSGGGGSYVPFGSFSVPQTVAAAVGVQILASPRQVVFTKSVGGNVPITNNPQVAAGANVGDELMIVGTSDTNYISLADGNGLALNGPIDLGANKAVTLVWIGSVWLENSRR